MKNFKISLGLLAIIIFINCVVPVTLHAQVKLSNQTKSPQIDFAIAEINKATETNTLASPIEIVIVGDSAKAVAMANQNQLQQPKYFGWQAFSIRKNANQIFVLASEPTGAMYGCLEIAQRIKNQTLVDIQHSDNKPYLERRGIKFNIPLDVRTPSYSDASTISQANMKDVWDINFWKEYFDQMAIRKFNVMTWWSLNPFPSMVNVPEFSDVSLNDVWKTKMPFDDNFPLTGKDAIRPEMLANHEVIKKISIKEKTKYWQQVMQLANDRGIEIYIFTWNIFPDIAEGKYGITSQQTNLQTIKYFRSATKELLKTYPLLKGFGITAGENMQKLKGEFSDENWLWKTYGEGISDALKENPKEDFTLIHRFHSASPTEIKDAFKDYPGKLQLSLKYSIAHMYSITNPSFTYPSFKVLNNDVKSWLTIRNDDIYNMRWANIDYARSYIKVR